MSQGFCQLAETGCRGALFFGVHHSSSYPINYLSTDASVARHLNEELMNRCRPLPTMVAYSPYLTLRIDTVHCPVPSFG